jgi:hypothetical protein
VFVDFVFGFGVLYEKIKGQEPQFLTRVTLKCFKVPTLFVETIITNQANNVLPRLAKGP